MHPCFPLLHATRKQGRPKLFHPDESTKNGNELGILPWHPQHTKTCFRGDK